MTYARIAVLSALALSIALGCSAPAPVRLADDLPSQAAYATVKIVMTLDDGRRTCSSAVLIDVDRNPFTQDLLGVFLTARHAVDHRGSVIEVGFYLPGAKVAKYIRQASSAIKHPIMDAALFLVPDLPEEFAVAVKFAASDPVLGARILSAGYADCGVLSLALGYVIGQSTWRNQQALLSTARTIPGMSGGAVLNEQGELVGITVAHGNGNRSLHYFLPIAAVRNWVRSQ